MQDPDDTEYFQRRAEEEHAAAKSANDERAARSHRALAKRYEHKATDGEEAPGGSDEAGSSGTSQEFRIIP